jgi:hypothetical protein
MIHHVVVGSSDDHNSLTEWTVVASLFGKNTCLKEKGPVDVFDQALLIKTTSALSFTAKGKEETKAACSAG